MDQTVIPMANPYVRQSDSLLVLPAADASGRVLKCLGCTYTGFLPPVRFEHLRPGRIAFIGSSTYPLPGKHLRFRSSQPFHTLAACRRTKPLIFPDSS